MNAVVGAHRERRADRLDHAGGARGEGVTVLPAFFSLRRSASSTANSS